MTDTKNEELTTEYGPDDPPPTPPPELYPGIEWMQVYGCYPGPGFYGTGPCLGAALYKSAIEERPWSAHYLDEHLFCGSQEDCITVLRNHIVQHANDLATMLLEHMDFEDPEAGNDDA